MKYEHQNIMAGECLITKIVSDLMLARESMTSSHIVLPTQRLHVYVTRELCRLQNGAALLPHLWTWDQFVKEVTSEYLNKNLVMVSSQCELIMEHVLEQREKKQTKVLNTNSRHAHELVYFAAELAKAGLGHEAKQKVADYLERDWRRSEDVYASISERVSDVFSALTDYDEQLAALNWTTPEKSRSDAVAGWLEADSIQQGLSIPEGRIIIAGLTSLPLLESKLLGKISKRDSVGVWMDESPPFDTDSPILELRRIVGMPAVTAPKEVWARGVKSIVSAFDITHEVAHSLLRVKELMDQGIPAHEIAIIVPDESAHGPSLLALAATSSCSVNIPLATQWGTTFIGRWFSLVTELSRKYDIHLVGQYLLHPYTQLLFGAKSTFNSDDLQYQLKDFPQVEHDPTAIFDFFDLELLDRRSGMRRRKFSPEDAAYMKKALSWCERFEGSTITAAAEELTRIYEALSNASMDSESTTISRSKDSATWTFFREAINQVCALAPLRGYKTSDWKNLLRDIYRTASEQSVRDTGEPLSGLQILGLTEARYVPFAAALIVGCAEGSFPHSLPKDSLLDNTMKGIIGLPGWTELEALEDTTFHLLTSRLPHVELSYAHTDSGSPKIRSRWIEQLTPRISVYEISGSRAHELFPCNKGRDLTSDAGVTLDGYAPDYLKLTETASASRLRNLILCPFRYLMDARKLKMVELPEDRESSLIGTLLHSVLEAFFTPRDGLVIEDDLQLKNCPEECDSFKIWARRRLDVLSQDLIPRKYVRTPVFQHMTGSGWEKVTDFWWGLIVGGFPLNKVGTEVAIGKSGKLSLSFSGREIVISGSIDAIHKGPEASLLIDYKTNYTPSNSNVAKGLEPQLVLYAYALSTSSDSSLAPFQSTIDRSATAYYSLTNGKASYVSFGENAKRYFLDAKLISSRSRASNLEGALEAVTSRWENRLKHIDETEHFSADPSICTFCNYSGICRKDDPRYRTRINQQKVAIPPPKTLAEVTESNDDDTPEEGDEP